MNALKSRLVQLRVPEEVLRRIDRQVREGMYRSRSDLILDATRRFLERLAPSLPLEAFIERYMAGRVEAFKDAPQVVGRIFDKVREDSAWVERFGGSPEEVMDRLRRRPR